MYESVHYAVAHCCEWMTLYLQQTSDHCILVRWYVTSSLADAAIIIKTLLTTWYDPPPLWLHVYLARLLVIITDHQGITNSSAISLVAMGREKNKTLCNFICWQTFLSHFATLCHVTFEAMHDTCLKTINFTKSMAITLITMYGIVSE